MAAWLAGFLVSVAIRQDASRLPHDTDASGPTVISAATLAAVSAWFPGLTPQDTRLRFRTNLEISGVPAFWEDRLFGSPGRWWILTSGRSRSRASIPASAASCRRATHGAGSRRRASENPRHETRTDLTRLGRPLAVQSLLPPRRQYADPGISSRQDAPGRG